MNTADERVRLLVVDDVHAVGTWKTVMIQVWRGAPTGPLSAEVNELTVRFMRESTLAVCALFVVERGSPPPDEACRKNLATFSRDLVSRMGIAVVLSEGSGFRAALVRAVGVAITTFCRTRRSSNSSMSSQRQRSCSSHTWGPGRTTPLASRAQSRNCVRRLEVRSRRRGACRGVAGELLRRIDPSPRPRERHGTGILARDWSRGRTALAARDGR